MNFVDAHNRTLHNPAFSDARPASRLRPIHSFVRREGRITHAQQRALMEYWPSFGVDAEAGLLDFKILFGRDAPRILEIGFGNGESLAALAAEHPDQDYLGIEVHRPGVGHLLLRATALRLTNLRVLCADAVEALERQIPDDHLDRLQLFFPDPWPKARHQKRRLIQAERVPLFLRKLKPGGQWHIATDCADYAEAVLALLNAAPELQNMADDSGFFPRPAGRPLTRFEQRGQRLGHPIRDLLFIRRPLTENSPLSRWERDSGEGPERLLPRK